MIVAEWEFPELSAKLNAAAQTVRQEITVAMQTNRGMLFDAQGAHNGHDPWAPLVFRAGQILADRGVLKKSLAPGSPDGQPGPGGYVRTDGGVTIVIGTNVAYARMANFGTTKLPGGVLRPKNGKVLAIPLPAGKSANANAKAARKGAKRRKSKRTGKVQSFIFVRSVKIPARRFDQVNEADAREIELAARNAIEEVLRA